MTDNMPQLLLSVSFQTCLHYVSLQAFILPLTASPFTFTSDTKWLVYTHMHKHKQLSLWHSLLLYISSKLLYCKARAHVVKNLRRTRPEDSGVPHKNLTSVHLHRVKNLNLFSFYALIQKNRSPNYVHLPYFNANTNPHIKSHRSSLLLLESD